MATATIAPATIEERRQKAVEACKLAYGPLPPSTPGAPSLCWTGRLQKAVELGQQAYSAGDPDRAKQISQAIATLNESANNAREAAKQAQFNYETLCNSLGRKAVDVMPPKCDCAGCQIADAQTRYFEAEFKLRKAVYDVLLPYGALDKLPRLISLMEDDKTRLWTMLDAIGQAMIAYRAACEAYGVEPKWQKVWA